MSELIKIKSKKTWSRHTLDELKNRCSIKGYEFLNIRSNSYIPKLTDVLNVRCIKHDYEFEVKVNRLILDCCNCQLCRNENTAIANSKSTIEEVFQIAKEKDYDVLTKMITSCDDTVQFICNKHQDYGVQNTSLYGMRRYKNNCKLCNVLSGEKHYNWKGGISTERDSFMSSYEYLQWRRLVFKRDNYTCQHCGRNSTLVKLNAHHIKNYSQYPEIRTDVNNGITLCEECHLPTYKNSFHSIYGIQNNTEQQLEEFLSEIGELADML